MSFSLPVFVLLLNPIVAEQLPTKSEILRKANECFKDLQDKVCSNLFLEIEKLQLVESEQNRYKCQASILGLQTELIEACLLYTSPSPRDRTRSRMPSSA